MCPKWLFLHVPHPLPLAFTLHAPLPLPALCLVAFYSFNDSKDKTLDLSQKLSKL